MDLNTITPNMLLSNEYGLSTASLSRDQLYYYRLKTSTDSYFVYITFAYIYSLKQWFIAAFYNLSGATLYTTFFNYFILSSTYFGAFWSNITNSLQG